MASGAPPPLRERAATQDSPGPAAEQRPNLRPVGLLGHLVPGIDVTDDPLLQVRLFSSLDTQISRLGGPRRVPAGPAAPR